MRPPVNKFYKLKACLLVALIAGSLNLAVASPAESQDANQKLTVEEIRQLVDSHKKVLPEWCGKDYTGEYNLGPWPENVSSIYKMEGCSLLPEDATWDEMILIEKFQAEWRPYGCCHVDFWEHNDVFRERRLTVEYPFSQNSASCKFLSYTIFCGGFMDEQDFFRDLFSRLRHIEFRESGYEILEHLESLLPATTNLIRFANNDGMTYIEESAILHELFYTIYSYKYFFDEFGDGGPEEPLYFRDIPHIYNSMILELEILDSDTGKPIPDARVELTSQWNDNPIIAYSNSNGVVRINLLFADNYPLHWIIDKCSEDTVGREYAASRNFIFDTDEPVDTSKRYMFHWYGKLDADPADQIFEVYTYRVIADDYKTLETRSLIDVAEFELNEYDYNYNYYSVFLGRRIQKKQINMEKGTSSPATRRYDITRRTYCIGNTDADIKAWLNGSLSIAEYTNLK